MTKEEVASIVLYCTERKMSFKSRLEELGIAQWRFYEAKGRYEKAKDEYSPNELLELGGKGAFIPCPTLTRKAKRASGSQSEINGKLNIELQTAGGVMIRIQGELDSSQLRSIILSAVGHV